MDLNTATINRDAAQAAYLNALKEKSLSVDTGGSSRAVVFQDIDALLKQYQYWDRIVMELSQDTATGVNRQVAIATWNHAWTR